MFATHNIQVYHRNHVLQASPVELVVMLYDRAIVNLKTAGSRLEEGDLKEKGRLICQTVDIVAELQAVLDKERGGDIAAKLHQLYAYMLDRLTAANYENSPTLIAEVIRLLEELQQGWKGLAVRAANGPALHAPCVAPGAGARQFNSVG